MFELNIRLVASLLLQIFLLQLMHHEYTTVYFPI